MANDGIAFTTVWTGAVSTDVNTAGNWTGGVPVDTSIVGFLGASAGAGKAPTFSSALNGIQATLVYIDQVFPYPIGTSSNRAQIDAVTLIHKGSGKLWFKTGDNGTTFFLVDSPGSTDTFDIDLGGTGSIAKLSVMRGKGTVGGTPTGGTTVIANVITGFRDNIDSDVQLFMSGAGATTFRQYGGTVETQQTITNFLINGGRHVKSSTASATNVYQGGGYLSYESNGAITLLEGIAGMIDITKNRSVTLTITDAYFYAKYQPNYDNRLVVFTNGPHDERGAMNISR